MSQDKDDLFMCRYKSEGDLSSENLPDLIDLIIE